jgi:hypothetical protein
VDASLIKFLLRNQLGFKKLFGPLVIGLAQLLVRGRLRQGRRQFGFVELDQQLAFGDTRSPGEVDFLNWVNQFGC